MSLNPIHGGMRIVDRRKVSYSDIDRHIELSDADPQVKVLARLPLPELERSAAEAERARNHGMANMLRTAYDLRNSGVPPEVLKPGVLHEIATFDPREGRARTEYFGDPRVWRTQFECPAVPIEFDVTLARETAGALEAGYKLSEKPPAPPTPGSREWFGLTPK